MILIFYQFIIKYKVIIFYSLLKLRLIIFNLDKILS